MRQISTLAKNMMHMLTTHAFGLVIPLVMIPFIIRSIGIEDFGQYSLALVTSAYITTLVNFGFDYSGSKRISEVREDNERCSQILFTVTTIKALILLIILVLYISVYQLFDITNYWLFFWSILMVIESVLIPRWFFLGLERMNHITFAFSISKSLSTLLIVIFLLENLNIFYLPLSYFIASIVASLYIWYVIFQKLGMHYSGTNSKMILRELKFGSSMFLATASVSFYRNASIVYGGFMLSPYDLGVYSVAQKLVTTIQSFFNPITQALFPHFSLEAKRQDIQSFKNEIKLLIKKSLLISFLVVVILCVFSGHLWYFFTENKMVSYDLYVLSPIILFGPMNFIIGYVGLVNMNRERALLSVVILVSVLSSIYTPLIIYFSVDLTPLALLISELLIFVGLIKKFTKV